MANIAPSTTHPQRPPPPFLFQNPPSRNASSISLVPPPPSTTATSSATRATLLRPNSIRGPEASSSTAQLRNARPRPSATLTEGDRTDALWAEMQATLADVEVSAFKSTHLFGAAHAQALEELRAAQIGLARAWGKGVGDGDCAEKVLRDGKETGVDETREDGDEGEGLGARKRREANERFFEKVREGVKDVVGRLDGVAEAMGKVERESRDIWSPTDSVAPGSASATL